MGKLDTTAQNATTIVVDLAALDTGGAVVNGPEDLLDWDAIRWRPQEARVQRLRQRIFKATQAGDLKQVRNLQKLMLRSRANTLVSVRRVTQRNTGRHTPGVDGRVALSAQDRAALAMLLHRQGGPGRALPVRRVYIPRRAANARSGYRPSPIVPSRNGCATRWSPSGKRGWTPNSTGSGRAADVTTQSR